MAWSVIQLKYVEMQAIKQTTLTPLASWKIIDKISQRMAQTGVEAAETNTVETSSGNGTAVDTATTSVAKPAATSEDAAAAGRCVRH